MPKRGRGRPARNIDSQNSTQVDLSDNLPEFFQIYFAHKCSQRMKIPPSFMNNFDGIVPSIFTIKTSYDDDKCWQVHPDMIKRDWYFQKGWPEFVQQNSLQHGDFLTFTYHATSTTFFVKLFAINGCIKTSTTPNLKGQSRKTPASRSNS